MFTKILIANRGEIAVRIIRACKEMGIKTVAVYSKADANSLHVSLADESVCIGGAQVKESYLDMTAVISAAVTTRAQAIHPGYGLLSENAKFATLCHKCGIVFIGPSGDVINKMGDKENARITMKAAGVPTVPGSDVIEDINLAKEVADKIGYPLLVKARAGGGGKGIRLVNSSDEFELAFNTASNEALNAFGDGGLYMEKFLSPVKHIEMQILCDNFGNVICLGERECSMQRNNQKFIEESPSPAIDEKTRRKMIDASVKAARAVDYRNAGTIEYLYDTKGNFYFMEMNTRLQVEHPVTEMVTGIDLVKWQIRIASDLQLTIKQEDVKISGHAIECRVNAENPEFNFRPSCGEITFVHLPGGPGIRFDSMIYNGYEIPPYYDSMIGKLIVHGETRDEAIRKMRAALCELIVKGIDNNIDFQVEILGTHEFKSGNYFTNFMQKRAEANVK